MSHSVNLKTDTADKMAEELRKALRHYDKNPLATRRWWSGFLWGITLMAVLDYTDVHFCVGECDGRGREVSIP
jgi:hypothetical protein